MAAVVNLLRFKEPVDRHLFERAETELVPRMRAFAGFRRFEVVHTGEREVVLLISGDSVEVLDRLAAEIGSPWMREHVVPLLDGPPQRHVGPTLVSS